MPVQVRRTTTVPEGSEEEKAPLLGDRRDPESDGGVREKGASTKIKFQDETETTDSSEAEGAEGPDDGIGKKLKQILRRKKKEPEVSSSNPQPRPTTGDLLQAVQETQDIMRNNVENCLNNHNRRLEDALERTEQLNDVGSDFARVSRRARVRMWLRSNRRAICICTAVVLVIILAGVMATVAVLISKGIIKTF
ncbi:PREDICTED: uncharacterized protein LOC109486489 [Branchiostoma belcheri]|uniref:Uncharacterized protein LOC109486489 n=1 Tax=Branchiostoma belcheri TaxID=7741 RepID=A0A6P5AIZ0_BRABE|nr:PREDICTED: uncharacterized protein LOC109486489 [Branchiostoma belcheri]